MFNQTNEVPSTTTEQYESNYFDKDEYINRLAIDVVMNEDTLSFYMPDHIAAPAGKHETFEYNLNDIIDESMDQDKTQEVLRDIAKFNNLEAARAYYLDFLIERACDFIEECIDDGYQVEVK